MGEIFFGGGSLFEEKNIFGKPPWKKIISRKQFRGEKILIEKFLRPPDH